MESTQKKINKVELRNLQIEDYAQLAQSFTRVYADKDVFWTHEQIEKLISIFIHKRVCRRLIINIIPLKQSCTVL